ncbi:MAG: phosphotransferase family protein [Frankiaceae bacterium]
MADRHPNYREPAVLPAVLRRTTVPPAAREWVRRTTGARVLSWRRLPGASSSAVHALQLSDGGRVVLRRWTWRFVLEDEPVIARRELDALALAAAHGLPAPRVVSADVDGTHVGDGVPALLMSRLAGRAVAAPDLARLAEVAATIHEVDATGLPHAFFRWSMDALAAAPPAATRPALWERALDARCTAIPAYRDRFIHRDYHPGNVLWSRGRSTGVVDWPNACRGPWECDVATCRSNLARLSGPAAAEAFLHAYVALTGRAYHPYWDLNYLLEQDADHWTSDEVTRAEPLLERWLSDLGQR